MIRKKKVFKPMKIPRRLQSELPYKDKPKIAKIGRTNKLKKERVAVIRDKHEYKVSKMLLRNKV